MHVYSINNNKRETVIKITVVITLFIMFVITPHLSSFKDWIFGKFLTNPNTAELERLIIECLLAVLPSLSIYGILRWGFKEIFWKLPPFYLWHKIPDLSGKWKMTLHSEMKDSDRKIEVVIKQNWNKVSVSTKSPGGTTAVSNAAAIEINESRVLFRYAYTVHAEFCSYEGFNTLNYEDGRLRGTYFSEKNFLETELASLCGQDSQSECVRKLRKGVGSKGKMEWCRGD